MPVTTRLAATVSERDWERFEAVLAHLADDSLALRRGELDRTRITPSRVVPPEIVTMNSRTRFADECRGRVAQNRHIRRAHILDLARQAQRSSDLRL